MKKFLYPAALLLLLGSFSACRREEKECDLAKADQLQQRELLLNQREAALKAREDALAAREAGSGPGVASDGNYQSSSNAGYAASGTTTTTPKNGRKPGKGNNESGLNAAYTGSNSAVPGQYPESSERLLTDADLQYLSAWGKKVMLSEIYARHHYIFPDKALQAHFNQEYWYKGSERRLDRIKLTAIEKQNIAYLR